MNPHTIRRLFPKASAATIAANANDYGDNHATNEIPHAKPEQQPPALARKDEGKTQSTGLPFVRFVLRRVSLLDVDAKWGSVKDLLDGLAIAGLIPGDRENQISLQVTQEKVAHFAEEETLITITYP